MDVNYRTIFRPRRLAQASSPLVAAERRPSSSFISASLHNESQQTLHDESWRDPSHSQLPLSQCWAKCRPRVETNHSSRLGTARRATYCPKSTVKYYTHRGIWLVHFGLKALNGDSHREKEPATKGPEEKELPEGSFLAHPLPLLSHLNGNPVNLFPTAQEHQEKDQLCFPPVASKPPKQAKRNSAFQTKKSRKTIKRHFSYNRP